MKQDNPIHAAQPQLTTANIDIPDLVGIAIRSWPYAIVCTMLGLACGLVVLASMPPNYKATVRMALERSPVRYLQANKVTDGPNLEDDAWIQTHIISSEPVLLPVIQKLNLEADPEFVRVAAPESKSGESSLDFVTHLKATLKIYAGLAPPELLKPERTQLSAFRSLSERLWATWEAQPSVINLTVESKDPVKAAAIANAVAESYIESTVQRKASSSHLASKMVQDRLNELKNLAAQAERELLDFRVSNDTTASGSTDGSKTTISEVSTLTTGIVNARMAILEARTRLERLERTPPADWGTIIPDNPLITRMKEQALDAESRAVEMANRVGEQHEATIKLRKRTDELAATIQAERKHIAKTYANELEYATTRYEELSAALDKLLSSQNTNSSATARMRELQTAAETLRNLYNMTLQRATEASKTDDSKLVLPEARILTQATIPTQTESSKKRLILLAGSSGAGLALGLAIAFLLSFPIGVYRTTDQVKHSLGLIAFLVPRVKPVQSKESNASPGLSEYVLDRPFSRFAESLRSVWSLISMAQRENGTKVICVVSSLAGEGKTTVATNLASQASRHAEARILLIDADLHRRSLTLSQAPDASAGLLEAIHTPHRLSEFVVKRERSGVHLLPCPLTGRLPNAAQLLGSKSMEQLLDLARETYDLVIIEAPPIAAVTDTRMLAQFCDGFVFVVDWGRTRQRLILETFMEFPQLWERAICVILNKADPVALKSIEYYKGPSYHSYYSNEVAAPRSGAERTLT